MFINFNDEYKNIKHLDKLTQENINIDNKFYNDFILSQEHKWYGWMHERYKEDNPFLKYLFRWFRLLYYLRNKEINYFKKTRIYFNFPISSEWYFSTQNFFRTSDLVLLKDDLYKNIKKFKKNYAPDEKFWISIFKKNAIDAIYNFKPTAYHCGEYFKILNEFQSNHFYNHNDHKPYINISNSCLFARNLKGKNYDKIVNDIDERIRGEKYER